MDDVEFWDTVVRTMAGDKMEGDEVVMGEKIVFKDGREIEQTPTGVRFSDVVRPEVQEQAIKIIVGGLIAHKTTMSILKKVHEEMGDEATESAVWFYLGMDTEHRRHEAEIDRRIKELTGGK